MSMQRINVMFPDETARNLKRSIPARSRSKFVASAVDEKLKHKKNLKKDFIKSLKAQESIAREIMEDFKYVDAETLKYIP